MKKLYRAVRLLLAGAILLTSTLPLTVSGAKYHQKWYSSAFYVVNAADLKWSYIYSAQTNNAAREVNFTIPAGGAGYYAFFLTGGKGGNGPDLGGYYGGAGGPGGIAMGLVYLGVGDRVDVGLGSNGVTGNNYANSNANKGNSPARLNGTVYRGGHGGAGWGGSGGGMSIMFLTPSGGSKAEVAFAGGGGGGSRPENGGKTFAGHNANEGGGGGVINGPGDGAAYCGEIYNMDGQYQTTSNFGFSGGGGNGTTHGVNGNGATTNGGTSTGSDASGGWGGGGGAGYLGGGGGHTAPKAGDGNAAGAGGGGSSRVVATYNSKVLLAIPNMNSRSSDIWFSTLRHIGVSATFDGGNTYVGPNAYSNEDIDPNHVNELTLQYGTSRTNASPGSYNNNLPPRSFTGSASFYMCYVGDVAEIATAFYDGADWLVNEGWADNNLAGTPSWQQSETVPS
ncbi:MAG: hypothetical protein LBG83_05170 [Oscillospiraceae bacterium]|jgi:hypothetical protein|nr:hypothetical protein [Oscillospiraceae bacterium]